MSRHHTLRHNDCQDETVIVYTDLHETAAIQEGEALVRAIVAAIRRDPKLHAELRMALEHRI
jgi:hypothetical protein